MLRSSLSRKRNILQKVQEKLYNYVKIENDPHSVSSKILLNYYGKKALNVWLDYCVPLSLNQLKRIQ